MDTSGTTEASWRNFLSTIFKRKIQILLFFSFTACAIIIGTLLMTPTYEAKCQILVKMGRESVYVPTLPSKINVNPIIDINRQEKISLEIEIIKSRSLVEKVVKSMGPTVIYENLIYEKKGFPSDLQDATQLLIETAISKFNKDLKVERIKDSNLIEIKYRHKDPQMAAAVLSKFMDTYGSQHLAIHKNPKSYAFFQRQSELLKKELLEAEESLRAFKKKYDVTSFPQEQSLLLTQASDLQANLNLTVSQEAEIEKQVQQLRAPLKANPGILPQGYGANINFALINTLEKSLVDLELKENEFLSKYTVQSRMVQSIREEIQIIREKLDKNKKQVWAEVFSSKEAELKAINAKKEAQIAQIAEYKKMIEKLNQSERGLSDQESKVKEARQNYQLYLKKFEEARISDAMDSEKITSISVIEHPRVPFKPVSPNVLLNLICGFFLGVFGAFGLAFFLEYLNETVERPEDVEYFLQTPVLASIPELKHLTS